MTRFAFVLSRQDAFEDWMQDIRREYPDSYDVSPTLGGCIVRNGDDIIDEYDYEPDPHEAARVRY